jgi:hypothetical protein
MSARVLTCTSPVIPVAVWVTCLVTVFRARSATTALEWLVISHLGSHVGSQGRLSRAISAEIALNPKSVPATHADLRGECVPSQTVT